MNTADSRLEADELRRIRLDMGLTPAEAADRAGVSNFIWHRWEAGERPVAAHYAGLIREAHAAFRSADQPE